MKGIATIDKVKLLERYLNGEVSITAAAKDIGVTKKAVSLWIQLYKIGGPSESIITAVDENITYITPPVSDVFKSFWRRQSL